MGWEDLLANKEQISLPWCGGKTVAWGARVWSIKGRLPPEHGWHLFEIDGSRETRLVNREPTDPNPLLETESKHKPLRGYLVGDRIIPDYARVDPDPNKLFDQTLPVFLVEPGLERFCRAVVVKMTTGLVYLRQEFPQGPEQAVTEAYQDRRDSLDDIAGVTPALDLAFRWLSFQRTLAEERERERVRRREEEERRRVREEQLAEARRSMGTGVGRRTLGALDFPAAARAALAVSNSELLDVRPSINRGEWVVLFRYRARRFECVCDSNLHITDAGVCLAGNDHLFSLESLPSVIGEAIDNGRLHIFRHV